MPTPLEKARKNLPDLSGMDDQRAVRYLHNAYYSDMPIEQVAQKMGVKLAQEPTAEKPKESAGLFRSMGDMAIKGAQGVVDLGASVVGLGNLATGGKLGEGMSAIGYDPQRTNEMLGEGLSDSQKASDAAVQQAEGFTDTVVAAVQNPRSIAGSVAQSLPGMLAGGGIQAAIAKRVAGKAALSTAEGAAAAVGKSGAAARDAAMGTTAGRQAADAAIEKATGGLVTVGAGIEGAQTAGNVAQQAQAEGRGYTDYAPGALAAGLGTAIIGKVAGKLTGDAATDVFAGTKSGLTGSLPARMAKAGFSEGVLEEMPQSAQEQFFTNVALGKDSPFEGVANAAGMGAVTGAAMGIGLGGFSGNAQPTKGDKLQNEADKIRRDEKLPEVGPLTAAANAETESKARTVEDVADALKASPSAESSANSAQAATNSVADDMQDAANTLVQQTGKASISHVQRHLKIGYNRAARMLEQMERDGLVTPAAQDGSRTVLEKEEKQPQSTAGTAPAAINSVAPEIPVSDASAADQAAYAQATGEPIIQGQKQGEAAEALPEQLSKLEQKDNAADILTPNGTPFKTQMAARNRAKAEGSGYAAVPVDPANPDAGYVVRKQESTNGATPAAVLPAGAGTDAGRTDAAAGLGAGFGDQQSGAAEQGAGQPGELDQSGEPATGVADKPVAPRVEKGGRNLRNGAYKKNPLMTFLAQHGLAHTNGGKSLKTEFSPDKQLMVAGYGPVFRKNGRDLDELVQPAIEMGYLRADGTEQDLYALIQRAVGGEKIAPQYAAGAEDDMQARYEARMRLEQESAEDAASAPQLTEAEFYGLEQEVYDRIMMRTDDQLFTLEDDVPWDAPSNASTEDFLRALGAPEGEIKDAIAKKQASAQGNDRDSASAQEATAGASQSRDGKGDEGARPSLPVRPEPTSAVEGLTAPTREEIIAKQEREGKAEKSRLKAESEAERRAKADAEVGEFTLTGSDRAADVAAAAGQQDIFGSMGDESKATESQKTPEEDSKKSAPELDGQAAADQSANLDALFDEVLSEEIAKGEPASEKPAKPTALPPKKSALLQEAHKALGRDVTRNQVQKMRDRIAAEIESGTTNNGGVVANLKPAAIATLKKRLERLDHDLALFDDKVAAKAEKSAPQRGTVGMKLEAGQVVTTLTGRETTPFPKFNGAKGVSARGLKLVDKWLMENALAEAESLGDTFNATQFRANLDKPQQADKDAAEQYLFGEQPAVQPSILKPLGSAAKNTASGLANTIDALGALFGGNPGQLNSGFGFNEDTYAKAKPLFQQAIKDFGAAGSDIKEAMRAVIRMVMDKFGAQAAQNMKPYIVRFIADVENGEQEKDNAASGNKVLERDSAGRAPEPAMVSPVSDESGAAERGAGEDAGRSGGQGDGATGGPRLFDGSTAIAGERGDQLLPAGEQSADPESSTAGGDNGIGGGDSGLDGVSLDPIPADAVSASADKPDDEKARRAEQRRAENVVQGPGLDNIRASLPYLLGPQQEDVFKAETRFEKPDGYGMLFTNGTGTGKTYTGLGVVKRAALKGKQNILIIVPDNKIAADWMDSGVPLGLTITQLEDTQTAGKGIVITTYANAGTNMTLADRQWDMVVADEAHQLMQSEDGTVTAALQALRAVTNHPDGAGQRHAMLNRELFAERQQANDEYNTAKQQREDADTPSSRFAALEAKMETAAAKLKAIDAQLAEKQTAVRDQVKASQGAGRTRALFLSATPFAYEKTIDWAHGYLFDYGEGKTGENHASGSGVGHSYNSGDWREQFFMQHFGYRMRYNKLTAPDAKVDTGLMQRQFNSMLKKQGVLSGRTLEVKPDYDRRFILTESAIGNRIDQALDWLRETAHEDYKNDKNEGMRQVEQLIAKKFNYLSRRYLLESIKAQESIPVVKKHLALGRKVIVFHDYNKGGGFNPFDISDVDAELGNAQAEQVADAVRRFKAEFKDLVKYPFSSFKSPIRAYQDAFPDVMLINGLEKPADLLERYKKFQSDDTGPTVMLVQSDKNKGWSGHDTTGKYQRVLLNLGQPTQPTKSIQQEGRIYRTGQASDAIFRYMNTGTNWERWAFASTIAQRSSTAENLGMGEAARALKDAYIAAFEESDAYEPGHEGEGKGGKERDRAANNALSEYDRAKAFYFGTQKKNSKTKAQEGKDYFATPEPVGLKMVQWLDIRPGEAGMEPSGGHGAIARWFPEDTKLTVVEPSFNLRSRLALVVPPNTNIVGGDFEELHIANKFDGIAMNPPFGVGGKTAIEHLAKAAQHLNDGGRIVALLPTGPAADKRFEKWMYEKTERKASPLYVDPNHGPIYKGDTLTLTGFNTLKKIVVDKVDTVMGAKYVRDAKTEPSGGVNITAINKVEAGPRVELHEAAKNLYMVADITLPQVTFERAGTSVATRIVVLEKQINPAHVPAHGMNRDLSSIEDINQLFERLEDMNLPKRPKVDAPPVEEVADKPKKPAVSAERAEAAQKQSKEVGDTVKLDGKDYPVVIYTTNAGKDIKGTWVPTRDIAMKFADRPFQKKPLGWFVRERDFPAATGDDAPVFSRRKADEVAPVSRAPEKTPLYEAFRQLSRFDETFQTGASTATDLEQIAKDMTAKIVQGLGPNAPRITAGPSTAMQKDKRVPTLALSIELKNGDMVKLLDIFDNKTERPYVVIGNSEAGQGVGGATAYQIAFAWAHNNGKTMRPDPAGLTVINRLRRTEAMISSILHFGTDKHVEPHRDQYVALLEKVRKGGAEPDGTTEHSQPDVFNELEAIKRNQWQKGSTPDTISNNVNALITASSQLAVLREPKIRAFEVADGVLRLREDKQREIPLADMPLNEAAGEVRILGVVLRPASSGVGSSTLKRASVSYSVQRAIGRAKLDLGGRQQAAGDRNPSSIALNAIRETLGKLDESAPQGLTGSLYSRADQGAGKGLGKAATTQIAEQIAARWDNAPEIIVAGSIQDTAVPERVRQQDAEQRSQGAEGAPEGFFYQGKVYLIADQLASVTDVARVLFHESLGHYGLRGNFGKALDSVLLQVAAMRPNDMKAKAEEYGLDLSKERDRLIAAEEVLAEMAQNTPTLGFVKRAIAAIRQFLRELGLELELTDADIIANYLLPARGWVERGSGAAGVGLPMFSRTQVPPSDAGDIARSADFQAQVRAYMADLSKSSKKVSWWERTIGTQYHKAQQNADFKAVFDATQAYISSTSAFANNAAANAKGILPQLESLADLKMKWLSDADRKAIARPIFEGTLSWARDEDGELVEADDVATAGVVFTPAELQAEFGLNDQQIKLYQQFRAAVDKSLADMVVTDALRYLGKTIPDDLKRLAVDEPEIVRQAITKLLKDKADETGKEWMDAQRDMRTTLRRFDKQLTKIQQMTRPMEKANAKAKYEAEREILEQELQDRVDTAKAERDHAMRDQLVVGGKFDKIDSLKDRGYAPLTRFGKFHVTVTNPDNGSVEFFGLFETEREANKAARELASEGDVSQGILSEQSYKLFSGVNPETLEVMGEAMGVEDKAMFEAYIKMTKNQRSTMKRLLKRKGVPGFSEDVTRVLASFVTGNARASSANLHLGDATRAASNIKAGDVKDEAVKLVEYVKNPQEEAQKVRGLLFAQFLGGSVASALVNMTQPFTMTLPYLSQFSNPAKAAARLTAAMKTAVSAIDPKTEIGKALTRAEADGIVSPQEIHQLQAEVTRSSSYHRVLRKAGFVWGSFFSLAEQFNRRTTFIAAYEQAKADGKADPYGFATKAVEETQGIYNKANKPNWARGAVGGVVFTFKQYSISYLEFLQRLPRREQVFALALLMLAAGAEGLPFADDLDDMLDTLGQKLGFNWNSKRAKRQFLTEQLGMSPDFANILLRGGSAIPGVPLDVSSRMGMANLIPGTGLLLEHKKDKAQDVLEFIGPAGSVAQQAVAGMGKALEGDLIGAGKELLPVAMQNALKGADMLQTGMYRDRGGRKVVDSTGGEAFIKGMGFQPRAVADTQMRTRIVSQDNELAKAKESQFAQRWAEARFEGDQDTEAEIRAELQRWNERNPEARIRINMADIAKRVRNMKQDKTQRTIKQATPEMRAHTREVLQ